MSMRSSRKSRRRNHAIAMATEPEAPSTNSKNEILETPAKKRSDSISSSSSSSSMTAPPSSSRKSRRARRESRAHSLSLQQAQQDNDLIDQHLDGTNAEHVEALIRDLEDEVTFRCRKIRDAAERGCIELRNALQVELMRMPKAIRKMGLKEFEETYGGCVRSVTEKSVDKEIEDVVNTARKRARTGENAAPETPGGRKQNSRVTRSAIKALQNNTNTYGNDTVTPLKPNRLVCNTPATMRVPRNGEVVMSMNGSPLAQDDARMIATIKKRKNNEVNSQSAIALELDTGDGSFVNLAVPGVVDTMDKSMKANAVSKLKSLQDEVAALMAQLGNGG